MKTFKYNSKYFGFAMAIPDDCSLSPIVDLIQTDDLLHNCDSFGFPPRLISDSRTIVGSNGKYLHILVTPLSGDKPEPTISQTEEYFDDFSNRQNLMVIATGTIKVANKEHFWATYYRGYLLTIASGGEMQFFKKYCLYLNRAEYLITAGLYCVGAEDKMPTDHDLHESERIFDEMVSSIILMNA